MKKTMCALTMLGVSCCAFTASASERATATDTPPATTSRNGNAATSTQHVQVDLNSRARWRCWWRRGERWCGWW